jgi:2-iminobutanoate/2-iminopropanoate deaminase
MRSTRQDIIMATEAIVTNRIAKPVGPFSAAIRDGGRVYTSGHVAQDPATGKLIGERSVAAQTEQVLENLAAVLDAAGKSFADVVKVSVFLTDMQSFGEMNDVYARYFSAPYPARTTVEVAALPLGAAVEIDLVASLGEID